MLQVWRDYLLLPSCAQHNIQEGTRSLPDVRANNSVGPLPVHCIDAFPPRHEDYINNQKAAKERLKAPVQELKDRFQRKALLRAFLRKSIFNGGEVNYLTILRKKRFHVYWSDDVVRAMANVFEVTNSKANRPDQFDAQKVLFRFAGKNVGELEMRNDGVKHYGEVRFNMNREPCIDLLDAAGLEQAEWSDEVLLFGQAVNTFGSWVATQENT